MTGLGSSPRVRGTLVDGDFMQAEHGIIPACAGNTVSVEIEGVIVGDHPRVCGEHQRAYEKLIGRSGSSPRVRGTLNADCRVV